MKTWKRILIMLMLLGLVGCAAVTPEESVLPDASTEATDSTAAPAEQGDAEPITITICSQASDAWLGYLEGDIADRLLEQMNIRIYIDPDIMGVLESDIAIWDSSVASYQEMLCERVADGDILNWADNGLLEQYGAQMAEQLADAFAEGRSYFGLSGDEDAVYGFLDRIAAQPLTAYYTWDIRADIYAQTEQTACNTLEDLTQILEAMQTVAREQDESVYAVSLPWPDTEGVCQPAEMLLAAYYGKQLEGAVVYDPATGSVSSVLEEDGAYIAVLQWLNTLYRKGLLDPDSYGQDWNDLVQKTKDGKVLFSVLYSTGSALTLQEGQWESLIPSESVIMLYEEEAYRKVWVINADTEYPEKCIELINWLVTAEDADALAEDLMVNTYIWQEETEISQKTTEIMESYRYVLHDDTAALDDTPDQWDAVCQVLREGSAAAVYAESEEAFWQAIAQLEADAAEAGYDACLAYAKDSLR
ncbi:MAG: extracellular solute-binding protein [Firmicutes bacterium]|nr:extracellular solute-binding protein [Bacillota bacterium]